MLMMGGLGVGMDAGNLFALLEDEMSPDDRRGVLYRCCHTCRVVLPHSLSVQPINQIFFFVQIRSFFRIAL